MNHFILRLLVPVVLLTASPLPAAAQTCNALDGTWTLLPEKGNLGSGLSFNPWYAITGVRRQGPRRNTSRRSITEIGLSPYWMISSSSPSGAMTKVLVVWISMPNRRL